MYRSRNANDSFVTASEWRSPQGVVARHRCVARMPGYADQTSPLGSALNGQRQEGPARVPLPSSANVPHGGSAWRERLFGAGQHTGAKASGRVNRRGRSARPTRGNRRTPSCGCQTRRCSTSLPRCRYRRPTPRWWRQASQTTGRPTPRSVRSGSGRRSCRPRPRCHPRRRCHPATLFAFVIGRRLSPHDVVTPDDVVRPGGCACRWHRPRRRCRPHHVVAPHDVLAVDGRRLRDGTHQPVAARADASGRSPRQMQSSHGVQRTAPGPGRPYGAPLASVSSER